MGTPWQVPHSSPSLAQGPLVGHTSDSTASVWARASEPGKYALVVTSPDGVELRTSATASADHDACMVFQLNSLLAGSRYAYRVESSQGEIVSPPTELTFQTAPGPESDSSVRLMFASCAREDDATAEAWTGAAREGPDAVVLLGDTPYIDSTDLAFQRTRYAAFASFSPMVALLQSTPWYGTWDDHDFGLNDVDGRLDGKASSRRAFVEYHANPSYGDGSQGIYTKFRRGPVEVFLLDTRTFAATEASTFKRHSASLLGAAQWSWLFKELRASTAPVKVLCCGMIWNGATRPGKLDHWGSYPHERDGLFRFIGEHKVEGVVLVGGDVHRSRVVSHASEGLAGYDIMELIVSPMHDGIIDAANRAHPGLIKDMGEPRTFLLVDAAQKDGQLTSLRARFVNGQGSEHFAIDLNQER